MRPHKNGKHKHGPLNGKASDATPTPAPPELVVPISPQAALESAQQQVLRALPAIIAGLAEQSQASHQHARFLFEFAGLAPGALPPEAAGPSFAEILLDRLGSIAVEEVRPPAESTDA
ncbi:MAG TPA: hypothetical protein VLE48_05785 [Terriglobales bacterium]|nr:hypothetical protein [Terriglobales bacterium]